MIKNFQKFNEKLSITEETITSDQIIEKYKLTRNSKFLDDFLGWIKIYPFVGGYLVNNNRVRSDINSYYCEQNTPSDYTRFYVNVIEYEIHSFLEKNYSLRIICNSYFNINKKSTFIEKIVIQIPLGDVTLTKVKEDIIFSKEDPYGEEDW